ncbi:MAG: DNA repair protein RecO [Kiritimatiellae bacterium]|nr:DNA repair protein RecO [Kiritimatiellia bacterium]
MAGETVKTEAICLRIVPWSQTSHIVTWFTPSGKVSTVVKGAVRPKSPFLGQYDLNYTCEIVYYARARGELHALRDCAPESMHETLRSDFRALLLAEHMRRIVGDLAPSGPDAADWYSLLEESLARLSDPSRGILRELVAFEMKALELAGLSPEMEASEGAFTLRGMRKIPVSAEVARCLADPSAEKNIQILLDAARVLGVFYTFHVESVPETRRAVLQVASTTEQGGKSK